MKSENFPLYIGDYFLSLIDKKEYVVMTVDPLGQIFVRMITFDPVKDDPNLGAMHKWEGGNNYKKIKD